MSVAYRSRSILALLALAVAAPAAAQRCPTPSTLGVAAGQPAAAVRFLSHDALAGRLAGNPEERCAAEYVAAEMARIGLTPAGEESGWFQAVEL
ncbi:MAG TPA: hypothetical protein VMK65_02430, partial [Longimicrobiales bacterium]|nr:hypothetical protein [Longimicrobiales bacterium]